MTKQEAIELAIPFFINHQVDLFYVTADGQLFYHEHHALSHANRLPKDQQQVQTVTRKEATGKKEEEVKKAETKKAETKAIKEK